jgi:hypothetical protein
MSRPAKPSSKSRSSSTSWVLPSCQTT